jgi:hypothetical protein
MTVRATVFVLLSACVAVSAAPAGAVWREGFDTAQSATTNWRDSVSPPLANWRVLGEVDGRNGVLIGSGAKQRPSFLSLPLSIPGDCFALTVRARAQSNGTLRGLTFGLSHGDPQETTNRVCHAGLQSSGQFAVFGGTKWAEVAAYAPGAWVEMRLICEVRSRTMDVYLDGRKLNHWPINQWNHLRPDTVFLNDFAPDSDGAEIAVDEIAVEPTPQLAPPRNVRLDIRSATETALEWSPFPGDEVREVRVYRDRELIATEPAGRGLHVDRGLQPVTWHEYSVAAVLPDGREGIRSWPIAALTRPANEPRLPAAAEYDLVVVGATPSGIAAAIAAARLGSRVALVSPEPWIGGMMTGGLGRTDFGRKEACGGLFREFMEAVYEHYVTTYGADSPQAKACREGFYFEPKLAQEIFTKWLNAYPTLTLFRQHLLRGVTMENGALTGVLVFDKRRFARKQLRAKAFIDATYEGDLAAFAGAAYRVGRESKDDFGESLAGVLYWDVWQRKIVGGTGEGDRKVQAYNYRLCLTNLPENRVAPPPPDQYDRDRYVTLLGDIENGKLKALGFALSILPLPNDKYDANNHPQGNPSSDFIGGNFEFPEASYEEREKSVRGHTDHVLGLLYFLQHDADVPEAFRKEARTWGFPRDEFTDNGNFPTQLYVREARRIVGDYLFTQHDAQLAPGALRPPIHCDSIAVGAYSLDSHATALPKPDTPDELEGFFYTKADPYQIPYRCLLPKGISGLLVSGCVSSTHIGYGTLRMEPVFVAMGQAAGAACALITKARATTRTLNVAKLQRQLIDHGQVITLFEDVTPAHPHFAALQYFGTRGFFPGYEAEADSPVTREVAAQWLWTWLKERRPKLREDLSGGPHYSDVPTTHANYAAIESLRGLGVCPESAFRPEEPLRTDELQRWLRAFAPKSRVVGDLEVTVTRGDLCELLYRW